jgi:tRNA-Thr(GGU) m(6)t(6)A37 methyltransferase TsaA
MSIQMKPIGYVETNAEHIPRHWSVSDVEGRLVIDRQYQEGLKDIKPGQKIIVIFHFHKSGQFTPAHLCQTPPHRNDRLGVFSICSPIRPNPVGLSVLEVTDVQDNVIHVKHVDMLNGTPIIDIKPNIRDKHACPSYNNEPEN